MWSTQPTDRPNVVMLHDYPPWSGGGLAIASRELALLLQRSFQFRILTSRLADHFADDRPRIAAAACEGPSPIMARAWPWRILRDVAHARALVVHWTFSFRWLSTGLLLASPLTGRPTVCVVHTAPDHCNYNRLRRLPRSWRSLLLRLAGAAMSRCAAIVALSPSHAEALTGSGINVTHTLPLPVRPTATYQRSYLGRSNSPIEVIGFAGELSQLKGADHLIGLIRVLTPAWSFDIAGTGPLHARFSAEIGTLAPTKRARVQLRGHLAPDEMRNFYPGIDVLLVPSRSESQCRVVLEAMLCGVLVLASRTHGIVDLIVPGKTGFFIDPGDVHAVQRCLDRAAHDPGTLDLIRHNARSAALEHYRTGRQAWLELLCDMAETVKGIEANRTELPGKPAC
jgi:glycosyltransferase involved in cell wall biosynthesis